MFDFSPCLLLMEWGVRAAVVPQLHRGAMLVNGKGWRSTCNKM